MPIGPVGLILIGILYLVKPAVFRRAIGKRPADSQQMRLPDHNYTFMRLLGSACIIVGVFLLSRYYHK
jgi:uncharacterized protein YjeT (DUF2065 family)